MRQHRPSISLACCLALIAGALTAQDPNAGPRAFGVNYFDCFIRHLKNRADASFDAGFAELGRRGIPFARFAATGYWPVDLRLYLDDRAEYFRRLDAVVASAGRHGVGLIPSLFWYAACVPDLVGEPLDCWGLRDSRTHAFMRTYVQEVVGRYRGDPTIWAWEFGNEYHLGASLPNAAEHRPACHPTLGTPATRSERDDLTFAHLRVAYAAFADEVRRLDPERPLITGDAFPRPSAWHQEHHRSWDRDDQAQAASALRDATPAAFTLVSVHLYEDDDARLPGTVLAAKAMGRPVFVGEFGAPGVGDDAEAHHRRLFRAVMDADVRWAALWVYDFPSQPEWSVTPDRARAYQLDLLTSANAHFRAATPLPKP